MTILGKFGLGVEMVGFLLMYVATLGRYRRLANIAAVLLMGGFILFGIGLIAFALYA